MKKTISIFNGTPSTNVQGSLYESYVKDGKLDKEILSLVPMETKIAIPEETEKSSTTVKLNNQVSRTF